MSTATLERGVWSTNSNCLACLGNSWCLRGLPCAFWGKTHVLSNFCPPRQLCAHARCRNPADFSPAYSFDPKSNRLYLNYQDDLGYLSVIDMKSGKWLNGFQHKDIVSVLCYFVFSCFDLIFFFWLDKKLIYGVANTHQMHSSLLVSLVLPSQAMKLTLLEHLRAARWTARLASAHSICKRMAIETKVCFDLKVYFFSLW